MLTITMNWIQSVSGTRGWLEKLDDSFMDHKPNTCQYNAPIMLSATCCSDHTRWHKNLVHRLQLDLIFDSHGFFVWVQKCPCLFRMSGISSSCRHAYMKCVSSTALLISIKIFFSLTCRCPSASFLSQRATDVSKQRIYRRRQFLSETLFYSLSIITWHNKNVTKTLMKTSVHFCDTYRNHQNILDIDIL